MVYSICLEFASGNPGGSLVFAEEWTAAVISPACFKHAGRTLGKVGAGVAVGDIVRGLEELCLARSERVTRDHELVRKRQERKLREGRRDAGSRALRTCQSWE